MRGALPKIEDVVLLGKTVLLRADLNVTFRPGTTEISDDSRIHASVATVELLRNCGASIVLCSHLGRPKGQVVTELRIEPVRSRVSEVLGFDVKEAGGPIGDHTKRVVDGLNDGDVAILENLRFDPGEEANNPEFASALASLADVYVNDAFGASHRSHASIVGVAEILPSYAGLLMRAEMGALDRALVSDEHPSIAVLGGAKVADKLEVVKNLALNVDAVLIGGGMVTALLAAQGISVGSTELSKEELAAADALLQDAGIAEKIRLPRDVVVAEEFDPASGYSEVGLRRFQVRVSSLTLELKRLRSTWDSSENRERSFGMGLWGCSSGKRFLRGQKGSLWRLRVMTTPSNSLVAGRRSKRSTPSALLTG